MTTKNKILLGSLALSLYLPVTVFALPAFPMAFFGQVTIDGVNAPIGTVIKAYYGNTLAGQILVNEAGIYGYTEVTKQKLTISEGGGPITFKFQTPSFNSGDEWTGINVITQDIFVSASTTQKKLSFVVTPIVTTNQIAPDLNGNATINNSKPEVVVSSPTQPVIVFVTDGVTNALLDFGALVTGGIGTLPKTTITSTSAKVDIPAATLVTSVDNTWKGVMSAPTAIVVALPETSGQTKIFSTAIEVGFSSAKLSFDKGVRLLLVGQAGKRAGYIRIGSSFTEITSVCTADNQETGNSLVVDGECKIDSGSDLVVWTKHFTSFATYTQTNTVVSSGGGGGGGGGGTIAPTIKTILPTVKIVGDMTGDGGVDIFDFALLMSNWAKIGLNVSDLNKDNKVDIFDFALLMSQWGKIK